MTFAAATTTTTKKNPSKIIECFYTPYLTEGAGVTWRAETGSIQDITLAFILTLALFAASLAPVQSITC